MVYIKTVTAGMSLEHTSN